MTPTIGVVRVKEFVDSEWEEISLWRDKDRAIENIREIRSLTFTILEPKPLSLERQEYLYKNIQPLLPREYWYNAFLQQKNISEPNLSSN